MTERSVMLSVAEMIATIQNSLRPYIGVVCEVADHMPLIEILLDGYFYGHVPGRQQSLVRLLSDYGLPTERAQQAANVVQTQLLGQINRAFGIIYPSRPYRYQFIGEDILIREGDPPYVRLDLAAIPPEDLVNTEDNGDWIPERLRR